MQASQCREEAGGHEDSFWTLVIGSGLSDLDIGWCVSRPHIHAAYCMLLSMNEANFKGKVDEEARDGVLG